MVNARALIYCLCLYALSGGGAVTVMSIAMLLAYDFGAHHELARETAIAQQFNHESRP